VSPGPGDAPDATFVAVLDYGIGNLRSAERALRHVGAPARLVEDPDEVAGAAGVVLPGVGAFAACARALRVSGLEGAARDALDRGIPFLGICVGFQLLYEDSEESPGARGLGVLPGTVRALPATVKRPQMQWNLLVPHGTGPSALRAAVGVGAWVYFVHSFAPDVGPECVAVCDYGGPVAAAVESGNLWGTQFHPEKSGSAGLALLAAFAARCGPAGRDEDPAGRDEDPAGRDEDPAGRDEDPAAAAR
jgi:glutamine amidotransferase